MADSNEVRQDEIEELLRQAAAESPAAPAAQHPRGPGAGGAGTAAAARPTIGGAAARDALSDVATHDDIQFLLRQAEEALASVDQPTAASLPGLSPFQLGELAGSPPSTEKTTLELLRDVELDLKIELGRTQMNLEDVLMLRKGSVVPLDKLAGDPVDVYVNGRLVARGEVLVLNDNFCVRVAELIVGEEAA